MDQCLKLQKSVKNNASDVQNFMLDLKNWEDGAKKKESNVIYGIDKDEMKKEIFTRSDVEYVKTAFENGCRQMKNHKWDLALESFSKAIRKYKKNPVFFIKRAQCYIKLNKPNEAEEDCSTALDIDPQILKAKFVRSQAREMKGDITGAAFDVQDVVLEDISNLKALNAFRRLRPLYFEEMRNSGYLFEKTDEEESKPGKADSILESLVKTEESSDVVAAKEERILNSQAEKEKGNQFVIKERWEEAIAAYSNAIQLNPNDPAFYANRALCRLKTKHEFLAILDCGMALKRKPNYVKVYMRRAVAKKALGDLIGARSDVKQVLKLEPNNNTAKTDLEELNKLIEESNSKKKKFSFSPETTNAETSIKKMKSEDICTKKSQEISYILPINKPNHLRSKKPLKRIPIKFIDDAIMEKLSKPSSKFHLSNEIQKQKKNVDDNRTNKLEEKQQTVIPLLQNQLKTEGMRNSETKGLNSITVKKEDNFLNEIKKVESDFQYILPINKKPHLRSKKPLQRIPIKFI